VGVKDDGISLRVRARLGLAVGLVVLSFGLTQPVEARAKLRVSVTPASAVAGEKVRVVVRGSGRTRCSLVMRADRRGARASVRRRVALRGRFTIPASASGKQFVSVKCGNRSAHVRLTVKRPASATPTPTAPTTPTGASGESDPLDSPTSPPTVVAPGTPCPLTESQLESIFGTSMPRVEGEPTICTFVSLEDGIPAVVEVSPFPQEGQPATAAELYALALEAGAPGLAKHPEWGGDSFSMIQPFDDMVTVIAIIIGSSQTLVVLPHPLTHDPVEVAQRLGDAIAETGTR
jgi:hypothetical protein